MRQVVDQIAKFNLVQQSLLLYVVWNMSSLWCADQLLTCQAAIWQRRLQHLQLGNISISYHIS